MWHPFFIQQTTDLGEIVTTIYSQIPLAEHDQYDKKLKNKTFTIHVLLE